MATLTLVVLSCLSTTPGIEVAVRVHCCSVVVSTRDLLYLSSFKSRNWSCFISISREIRLVHHVGSSKLVNSSVVKQHDSYVVTAADLLYFLPFKLGNHMELVQELLLDSFEPKFAM